jgi:hypothetical protein
VRTLTTILSVAAVALVAAACSHDDAKRAGDNDLQRDLQLATTSVDLARPATSNLDSLETAPPSAPEPSVSIRRAPRGNRAVRSPKPTVASAPEPKPAESVEETQQVAQAPARAEESERPPSSDGVALPRPAAIPVSLPGGGGPLAIPAEGGRGSGSNGGGIGGGIFGVVIRGGGVGDDDHCENDQRGGRGRPVYRPGPGGIGASRRGGMIGRGTFPVNY